MANKLKIECEHELFEREFTPADKPCYDGPRGCVHVFNPGERVCNCGEKIGKPLRIGGNQFLFGCKIKA